MRANSNKQNHNFMIGKTYIISKAWDSWRVGEEVTLRAINDDGTFSVARWCGMIVIATELKEIE
jgi:hypothetical protein